MLPRPINTHSDTIIEFYASIIMRIFPFLYIYQYTNIISFSNIKNRTKKDTK